ncbi:MAG: DUF2796 domain-containing protein [Gammaproteobacteria bacterium]|jgi:hypothetical protein|nr:DUF2796 domain-containing protein [Gammaproteobacteria bacterium]
MQSTLRAAALAVGLFAIGLSSADQPRREHAAHEHGKGTGTLAQDAGRWQLSLTLPGYNIVGFEHPPGNEQQQSRLARARERLESARWLQPDPESGCRVASTRVEATGYGAADDHGHEAHDHADAHDDHQHTAADHGHGHAAFHVTAVITCDASGRMRWLDIDLFDGFPDNRSIRLDVLSDSGAARHDLGRENFRIRFD